MNDAYLCDNEGIVINTKILAQYHKRATGHRIATIKIEVTGVLEE